MNDGASHIKNEHFWMNHARNVRSIVQKFLNWRSSQKNLHVIEEIVSLFGSFQEKLGSKKSFLRVSLLLDQIHMVTKQAKACPDCIFQSLTKSEEEPSMSFEFVYKID